MPEAVAASRAIVLSGDILAEYEKQAQATGIPVEQFIEKRLARCKRHSAERPLYFNDAQRRELEETLGGELFVDAGGVNAVLNRRYRFSIEGLRISLDADLQQAVNIRAQEMNMDVKDFLKEATMAGVRQKVGWE
jgi:hypothetical protein